MLNDTFSQSTRSQPQSLVRANHSITTPEKLAASFTISWSRRNHPSYTTRSPLDHKESHLLILHSTR